MSAADLPHPDGCHHCEDTADHHGWQWHPVAGHHQWTAPSDQLRLERMHARRAARLAQKAAVR